MYLHFFMKLGIYTEHFNIFIMKWTNPRKHENLMHITIMQSEGNQKQTVYSELCGVKFKLKVHNILYENLWKFTLCMLVGLLHKSGWIIKQK